MGERVPDMPTPISAELPVTVAGIVPADDHLRVDEPALTVEATSRFETFYFEHRDSVARAVALATGDPDQAADSTDEAMTRAFQRWDRVGSLRQPAGWVFRVAVNHSRSRIRRVARKARFANKLRGRDEATSIDDSLVDGSLRAALLRLDADQRAVVVMRVLLQFSELECAEALGIRPGTAKSRLSRGLARLRAEVPHLAPGIDEFHRHDGDPSDPTTRTSHVPAAPGHPTTREQEDS